MMSIKKGLSLKNRMKLKLVIVLTIATLLLSVFALYLSNDVEAKNSIDYIELHHEAYLNLKEKNPDYVGTFSDEDFNMEIRAVKGEDNSKYLYYVWERNNYSFEGSPYLDYENTLEDQNLILYNCHFDISDIYEGKNYYFFLKDELREYELCAIFDVDLVDENGTYYPEENLQFNLPFYNSEYFEVYKKSINEINLIDYSKDYSISDRFFTIVNEGDSDYSRRILFFVQRAKYSIVDCESLLSKMFNN